MKLLLITLVVATGCGLTTVRVQPVTVEPIHMTIDVNVHDQGQGAHTPTADEGKQPSK